MISPSPLPSPAGRGGSAGRGGPTVVIEPAGAHWEAGGAVRPVDQPLAWVGNDRLLLDDESRCGLRRRVLANRGDVPNQVAHVAEVYRRSNRVRFWMFERDGYWYLWIVWKE